MKKKSKKWVLKPSLDKNQTELFPEIDPIVLQLLFDRGLKTQKEIDQFLHPEYDTDIHDPFLFDHMQEAVDRILVAINNDESIIVHGDYDADGLSGSVILVSTIKYLGGKIVDAYMPHRETEGYGVNINTVKTLHKQGCKLIITTDCGISNVAEIQHARDLGMDVIITDHHTQQPQLPNAIILHPKVKGESYPFKDLAGGGVAFKLAQGLLHNNTKQNPDFESKNIAFEKWLLDMVAISSVADMVPLIGENRTLVKYGLIVLSKVKRLGLRTLLTLAGVYPPKYSRELKMAPYDIGFKIGPRLNAAGRIGHSNIAFQLLMSENESEAITLAENLEQTNRDRQKITMKMMDEAISQIGVVSETEPEVLIAYDPSWSVGVVGLVAGRVCERYHLPTFALAEIKGQIAGSGRSIEGFDCTEALDFAKDLFEKYGGHPRACGLTLKDKSLLPELRNRFNEFARNNLTKDHLQPKLKIDAKILIQDISWDFHDKINQLQPFGMGNPEPIFMVQKAHLVDISACGEDKKHLRFSVTHDHKTIRKAIAFNFGYFAEFTKVGSEVDIVFTIDINQWNGQRELQLKVKDIKTSYKK
jgi:single-stranded-DNA-specific exonuclease